MKPLRLFWMFLALLVFWQILSARVDPLFIAMGVASSAIVTLMSVRLLEGVLGPAASTPKIRFWALVRYVGWLAGTLPSAGIEVARVVLDPRVPPRPGVVHFRTGLTSPAARTLLANSITVIPGTMTLNVDDDEFIVHAFTPWEFDDLATAAMQRRIAAVFDDEPDEPPVLEWEAVHLLTPVDPHPHDLDDQAAS